MRRSDELKQCADLFFEAAYKPNQLERALSIAARLFSGEAGQIITIGSKGQYLSSVTTGLDLAALAKEVDYIPISPRFKALSTLQEGGVTFDYDVLTDEGIARDVTYQEYLKPNNVDWYAGAALIKNDHINVGLGFFRPDKFGHYSNSELKDFQWLSGQVAQAIRLRHELEAQQISAQISALELALGAIASISEAGKIIEMSTSFERIIAMSKVARLGVNRGLVSVDPAFKQWLDRGLRICRDRLLETNTSRISAPFRTRTTSGEWLEMTILPIPLKTRWFSTGAMAFMSLREVNDSAFDSGQMQEVFGFTEAEGRIGSLLALGKSVRDVAEESKISYETARFHAKAVYEKAECKGQAEWVYLANRLFYN